MQHRARWSMDAPSHSHVHSLAVATVIQDEARWLPEWLEYHVLEAVGVEHFFLYDDSSRDELSQSIAPYVAEGLVTLNKIASTGYLPATVPVTKELCEHPPKLNWGLLAWDAAGNCTRKLHFPQQLQMVRHVVRTYGHLTRYMAFIDVDEFVMMRKQPLPVILDELWAAQLSRGRIGGLSLRSLTMLSPGINHTRAPWEGSLVTKVMIKQINPTLLHRLEPESVAAGTKCVVKPSLLDTERCVPRLAYSISKAACRLSLVACRLSFVACRLSRVVLNT